MLLVDNASRNKRPTRGETKFPGLLRHASELAVHRNHLWLVLSGRRKSKSLLRRYINLIKEEGRTVPAELLGRL